MAFFNFSDPQVFAALPVDGPNSLYLSLRLSPRSGNSRGIGNLSREEREIDRGYMDFG